MDTTRGILSWKHRIAALGNIPPLLHLVWSSSHSSVAALVCLRVVVGCVPLAILAVTKSIINQVVLRVSSGTSPHPEFWWLVMLEFTLTSLTVIMSRVVDFFEARLADQFTLNVSVRIMEHGSRLDLASYEDPSFHDRLERARVQANDRVGTIHTIGRLIQEVITAASLMVGILAYSPLLILILLFAIPAFLGDCYLAMQGYELARQQTPLRREIEYVRTLGTSREAAKETRLFGLGQYWTALYRYLSQELYSQNLALALKRMLAGGFLALFATVGYYAAYATVLYRTLSGSYSVGTLAFLAGAIAGTSGKIQSILSMLSSISDQSIFVTDLFETLSTRPHIRSKPGALAVPCRINRGFELRNVSFSYEGTGLVVLRNLNLQLGADERVALIGSNGGGKTTLVKLLTRLYDPTEGEILLDGVDLREYDLEDLHAKMAVIFQDFVRYDRTAYDNIALGDLRSDNIRAVETAAKNSSADVFISKLPLRYAQMLGHRFDGGMDPSGGQWQRLALARAYMRDVGILILDEPTSALDATAERELLDRLALLAQGRMTLLISHRFSTVRMADRILVLENGAIVEDGSHSELLARGNRYSEMFTTQASNYL